MSDADMDFHALSDAQCLPAQTWREQYQETKDMIRKTLLLLAAGAIALTASACNTVKGVGRDIESVGEAADRAI